MAPNRPISLKNNTDSKTLKNVLANWNLQTGKVWDVCPALSHPLLRNWISWGEVPGWHICMTTGDWIRMKAWNKCDSLSWESDWLMRLSDLEFGADIFSEQGPQKKFPFSKVLELWLFKFWYTSPGLVFRSIPYTCYVLSLLCIMVRLTALESVS